MTLRSSHEDFGATFDDDGLPAHYGRPERTHRAVRNGVGVREERPGVLAVTGADRHDYLDDVVSNAVPREEGTGSYALLLDPDGAVRTDLYVLDAGDRLLVLADREVAADLAPEWNERTFIQDVEVTDLTDEFGVLGLHGPVATEKLAGVLHGASVPEERLTFVRGEVADAGVTVVRGDARAGEEEFLVVCGADDAARVFDALVSLGPSAVPFGRRTWHALTLEAGTPLFETELAGEVPNGIVGSGLDFEKGCFVGQEVVSRIENRGRPPRRLVGLRPESVPARGAPVFADGREVGEVTRAVESPVAGRPLALALASQPLGDAAVTVGDDVAAEATPLPHVEGSERSARVPGDDA